jgi:hypothetical protein
VSLRAHLQRIRDNHSYGWILGMVLLIVVLTIALPNDELARFSLVVIEASTLLVAVWTSQARPRTVRLVVTLAGAAIFMSLVATVLPGDASVALRAITVTLIAVLPFILAAGVIETIRSRGVALNAVAGVLTLYLLLGLLFGALFLLLNDIGSAPFFAGHTENVRSGDFIYFAFTTQTTVGYGDFVPGTDVGRALAACQAVVGQMYLVTVVAVVISQLGQRPRRVGAEAPDDA